MATTRRALFRILPPSWLADLLQANHRIAIATTPASDWRRLLYSSAEIDRASEAFRQVARG